LRRRFLFAFIGLQFDQFSRAFEYSPPKRFATIPNFILPTACLTDTVLDKTFALTIKLHSKLGKTNQIGIPLMLPLFPQAHGFYNSALAITKIFQLIPLSK